MFVSWCRPFHFSHIEVDRLGAGAPARLERPEVELHAEDRGEADARRKRAVIKVRD